MICRSAITILTIFTDYSKLIRVFPEFKDSLLEDCSLLINCWVFCFLARFMPINWLESMIDFEGQPLKEMPSIPEVEKLHSFHVFKYKNEAVRKLLMDFETQVLNESADLKTGFGLLIQTIFKQNKKKTVEKVKSETEMPQSKQRVNLDFFKLNLDNFLVKTAKRTKRILTRESDQTLRQNKLWSGSKRSESSLEHSAGRFQNNSFNSMDSSKKNNPTDKNSNSKKTEHNQSESLQCLILGLKSFEYMINVFDLLENFETNFYSTNVVETLEKFTLQCYYCEKLKTHKVFQRKIFQFPWNKLETPISGVRGHPYLSDIMEIIEDIVQDFKDPNLKLFGLKEEDINRFLYILFDFLLTLIIEIYSKIHNCSVNGRFQMKMDIQEIFNCIEKILPREEMSGPNYLCN